MQVTWVMIYWFKNALTGVFKYLVMNFNIQHLRADRHRTTFKYKQLLDISLELVEFKSLCSQMNYLRKIRCAW